MSLSISALAFAAALVALPASAADAQTAVSRDCSFFVTPANFTPPASNVAVHVSAPPHVQVEVFFTPDAPLNAPPVLVAGGDSGASGNVTFTKIVISTAGVISANFSTSPGNAYTTGCATVAGEAVVRVDPVTVAAATTNIAPLAFTGSSTTPSYVVAGLSAVIVGLVLLAASRRRFRMRG